MNALGIKDKPSKEKGYQQVGINTLPWPRAEIVSFLLENGIGAQRTGKGDQLAIVQADAFGVEVVDSPEVQLQMIAGGATSISPHSPLFSFPNAYLYSDIPFYSLLIPDISFSVLTTSHRERRWNLHPRER